MIKNEKYLDGSKAATHIMKELEKVPHTIRGDSALITCPFHSSYGRGPCYYRLSINLASKQQNGFYIPVGKFHCWSCGKVGFFNDLIINDELPKEKLLNIKPLPKSGSIEDSELFSKSLSILNKQDSSFIDLPEFVINKWYGSWRGITEKTLRAMGCKSFFDYNPRVKSRTGVPLVIGGITRLLFYVYNSDREKIAWLALATEKDRKKNKFCLKQKNMPGEWASKTVLFHEKFKDNIPLVLVEGPFDALHLIQNGIPSVAMMGAGNWSEDKRDLLASKASHIIVLFDGDDTGRKDSLIVYESLKDYVPTKRLLLPILEKKEDQIDPGNMSDKYIGVLKNKIKNFTQENI